MDLFRDTAFGHLIRFVSRGKYLKYPEEADPTIWTRFIDEKKSAYLAHHGNTNPPEEPDSSLDNLRGVRTQEMTSAPPRLSNLEQSDSDLSTNSEKPRINRASGAKVDPEKGRDLHLVTWYGDNDPENVSGSSQSLYSHGN